MTSAEDPTEGDASTTDTDGRDRYRWGPAEPPTTAIVRAVAAATDREPLAMPPLYDHVDADALDALVTARTTGNGTDGTVHVSFPYDGVRVLLDSDGGIEIGPDAIDDG